MKKIWIIFLLTMVSSSLFGQVNLVPNPSFEDTIVCPVGIGGIYNAVGWSSYRETPDYLISCNNGQAGVPYNLFGYQYAKTGNAYAGFYSFGKFASNYREIIGIQLLQPLIIGKSYFISFYVSRGFNPSPGFHINISTNKLGVRFSKLQYSYSNPIPIDNFAHVYSDSVISDTSNWVLISGLFIADSAYQYLSIGNFFTDLATTSILLDTAAVFSYYYIDDVVVIDSTTSGFQEYKSNFIEVFPNPARDWIVLEGKGIKPVEIINALGSTLGSYPTTAFTLQHKINISSLSRGIYFLKINMMDEHFQFQKIIIQN